MKTFKLIAFAVAVLLLVSCASSGGGGGKDREVWTFEDPAFDVGGWWLSTAENYLYKGPSKLSRDDTTLGKGLLRLDVDFTQNTENDWADIKIVQDYPRAVAMKGKTRFSFDFYYNPSLRTEGDFKPMVFSNNGGFLLNHTGESIEGGVDAGNGFLKKEVEVLIMPVNGYMPDLRFIIAGCLTDYKGPVFFDRLRWE